MLKALKTLLIILALFVGIFAAYDNVYAARYGISQTSVNSGLVGYWTFDGKDVDATKVYDKSGQGNTGTRTGGVTMGIGKIGQAGKFDGNDDYIDAGSGTSLKLTSNMTIATWIKLTPATFPDASTVWHIINSETFSTNGFIFRVHGETPKLYFRTNQVSAYTDIYSNTVLSKGVWYHAVIVKNGTNGTFYLNGSSDGGGTVSDPVAATLNFYIATRADIQTQSFNGLIDDARIYNRALSASEVWQLYKSTAGAKVAKSQTASGLDSGLVGWWTFDGKDVDATNVYDKSGQGNTGTRTGGVAMTIGKIGQAGKFDGDGDYLSTPSISLGTSHSFSFWMKDFEASSDPLIFSNNSGTTNYIQWYQGSNVFYYYDSVNYVTINAGSGFTDSNWNHVVITRSGTTVQLFINGLYINQSTLDSVGSLTITRIGGLSSGTLDLNGYLDDARIYSRALSAAEVWQLYKSTAGAKVAKSQTASGLDSALVGWWTFDGKDVDATYVYDKSGQNNTGTRTGGVTMGIGKIGQAGKFDGSDDYVSTPDIDSLTTAFTASYWVKAGAFAVYPDSFTKWGGSQNCFLIQHDSNGVGLYVYVASSLTDAGNNYCGATVNLSVGQWYYVTVVYDGAGAVDTDKVKVFLNGVQKTATCGGTIPSSLTASSAVQGIGQGISEGRYWDGNIDDLRLYSRALSASEVWQLYQMGR